MRMSSKYTTITPLSDEFVEDVVHHRLEGGRAIGETEEHNERFEEASVHSKCSLPLVTFLDANIVEPPSNVELGEVLCSSELRNELWGERKWILVLHGHGVQGTVVLHQTKFAIFFLNKEDGRGHRRF